MSPLPPVDILITGGTVVTMDPKRQIFTPGAVAVVGDRIAAVGDEAMLAGRLGEVRRRIDATGMVVMPGLIDAHAHAGHTLVKTLGYGSTTRWEEIITTLYSQASGPGFWEADARLSALERLMGGVTCGLSILGGYIIRTDDTIYADLHCTAYADAGLRCILAVGPCAPPFPRRFTDWQSGAPETRVVDFETQLANSIAVVETWHGASAGRIGTMLFAPLYWPGRRESGADLAAEFARQNLRVRDAARDLGVFVTQDNHQRGTVRAAHAQGMLGPNVLLSHCIDIEPDEVRLIAEAGAKVVHNPSARAALLGRCPVPELRDAGAVVAIGSDAASPDRSNDMFRHMLEAVRLQWRHSHDFSSPSPEDVLSMVTIEAAKAIGLEDRIGSLEVGKAADVILIDMHKPHLAPANMPLHRLVHYATAQDVDTVLVAGEVAMANRCPASFGVDATLHAADRELLLALKRAGLDGAKGNAHMAAAPATLMSRGTSRGEYRTSD